MITTKFEGTNHENIISESPPIIHQPLEDSIVPQQDLMEDLTLSPSGKQNSIMSLTLDEFQTKSGKSFGSMNMDEFLNNIWSSNGLDGNNLSLQPYHNTNDEPTFDQTLENQSNLPKQSTFSIPSPICKRTVDDVWVEIQRDSPQQQNLRNVSVREPLQRQQTYGEMTLEDFLVKAGIVQPRMINPSNHADAVNYPNCNSYFDDHNSKVDRASSRPYLDGHNIGQNVTNNGFRQYQMGTQNVILKGESSYYYGNEDERCESSRSNKRKRKEGSPDCQPKETNGRRQRRMLKNRESAARSRARKQAYTVELELELNQLKQENEKLKKTLSMMKKVETMEKKKRASETTTTSISRRLSMHW